VLFRRRPSGDLVIQFPKRFEEYILSGVGIGDATWPSPATCLCSASTCRECHTWI
jgi:hypothetical protein